MYEHDTLLGGRAPLAVRQGPQTLTPLGFAIPVVCSFHSIYYRRCRSPRRPPSITAQTRSLVHTVSHAPNSDIAATIEGFRGFAAATPRIPIRIEELVTEHGDLTAEHAEAAARQVESPKPLGVGMNPLKAIRHTHHRLAQLLAVGVDETVAAKLCNYGLSRVSILKSDPAFVELLAYYAGNVEDKWGDFVSTAANLSMDMLQELQARLDESPGEFTPSSLMEAIKLLADRSGHAPVQKSLNVNIHAGLGDRIRTARERAAEDYARSLVEGPPRDQ